jgi:hypothetical protein
MKRLIAFFAIAAFIVVFSACSKSSVDFQTPELNEYFPLETGKYITYNLDSVIV